MLFDSFFSSRFPTDVIFLLPEELPLIFHLLWDSSYIFICLWFLKIFSQYRTLGWQVFFCYFYVSLTSLLNCFHWASWWILTIAPVYVIPFFPLSTSNIFSLSLVLSDVMPRFLIVVLFVSLTFRFCWTSCRIVSFPQIKKLFNHFFFKKIFSLSLFFSDFNYTNSPLEIISQLILCSFF